MLTCFYACAAVNWFRIKLTNLRRHAPRIKPGLHKAVHVRRHYTKNELQSLLNSYPTTVNHRDVVDFTNFDERLSAVDCLVVNTIGVSEGFIEFIPDNEPPLKEEIFCWIWAIRPDLSNDLLDLEISEDFRVLLNSYIDNNMTRFWDYIS